MSDLDQVYAALLDARKTGDTEGEATLAKYLLGQHSEKPVSDDLKKAHPEEYDPDSPEFKAKYGATSSMSNAEKYAAGTGQGVERLYKGAGNLVGLGRLFPQTLGDQALKDEDTQDKPLLGTTAGSLGSQTGQVLGTVPLGMGSGALGRAVAGGAKLGSGTLAGALRAAGSGAQAAGEGALQGAAMADPDQQGSGAETGAVLSGAMRALGGVGGKITKGLVGKSPEAQAIIDAGTRQGQDIFIPISQGGTGPMKAVYQNVLPYALGVEGRLGGQSAEAAGQVRNILANEASPSKAGLLIGKTPQETSANIEKAFNNEYERTINNYSFTKPSNFRDDVAAHIQLDSPNIDEVSMNKVATKADELMAQYSETASKSPYLTGNNFVNIRKDLVAAADKAPDAEKPAYKSAINHVDDIVEQEIKNNTGAGKAGQAVVDDLRDYQGLRTAWKEYEPFRDSVNATKADLGKFNFGSYAQRAADDSQGQPLAQAAHAVLDKESPGAVNPAGRHFGHQAGAIAGGLGLGSLLGVGLGHPVVALTAGTVLGAGNLMSTKAAQRLLYGDTGWQTALADALRNNPQTAYSLGMGGRAAAVGASQ